MKKILSLILTLFCVLSLVGCGRSMDDIIKNESSITGVVEEVYNNSILLAPGGISHSGPGGNRQLWPDENSQS